MKKLFPYSLTAILILAVALSGCGGGKSVGPGGGYTGVPFTMVPVSGGLTFPTDIVANIFQDDTTATVANAYNIAQTEVTYELWTAVYDWATADARGVNKYAFAHNGRKGNDGAADKSNQHPVTTISWQDAIVWCNALTEYFAAKGGTSYQCVYYSDDKYATPIRSTSDSSIDAPYIYAGTTTGNIDMANCVAKGFRLPTSKEWELAARWRNDSTNTVDGFGTPWFTKGNSASGATTYYNNNTDGSGEPGKTVNDRVAVYGLYWDGSSWQSTGITGTAPVKSKVYGANSLGLYDMSGNVWEWCFDSGFPSRVFRGGGWNSAAGGLRLGGVNGVDPDYVDNNLGFRPVRTQ